jgi:K+-transporting ATPase A subunit
MSDLLILALIVARFVIFLVGVICIVGGLTLLPALSLGPIAEQMMMQPDGCIESC